MIKMSELFDKRAKFTRLIPQLINKMIADGYTPLHGKDGLKHMNIREFLLSEQWN